MNEIVRWDPREGIIGVVGVAPAATVDFYRKLVEMTPAKKDWEHVRVLIDSNPKIPSRGRHLELGETDPSPYIRESIIQLYRAGSTVIAVPCNTAHILYERYAVDLPPVELPHMITVTVDELMRAVGTPPRRVAVFASRLTTRHNLYGDALALHGGTLLDTSGTQEEVSSLIEEVKQGRPLLKCHDRMLRVLAQYPSADAVVVGCTELSLLLDQVHCRVPLIDSNVAMARACLAIAKKTAI